MGLSPGVVQTHINYWQRRLSVGNRPYRRRWPSRLFRHEPLENAVRILRAGVLLSRRDAADEIERDIAPAEIIARRGAAHDAVRLYFRPRTPTQYHIEGIRKPPEYFQGRHAPVLIIMVFRAEDILTQRGVTFSDGNMQSYGARTFRTDDEFQAMPFELIYHDGPFPREQGAEIVHSRCAEVLVPSPLELPDHLQAVLCRSPAERATLLHLLGDAANQWNGRIRVYGEPGLFESQYAYMDTVDGGPDGIDFTLHPRRDGLAVRTEMWTWDSDGNQVMHFDPTELDASEPWTSQTTFEPGTYVARFELEGCLAYEASFIIDELPF